MSYTDYAWNPVTGCSPVSEGCKHCYAKGIAERFAGTKAWPKNFEVTFHPNRMDEPFHWKTPRRVFVCNTGDLFHEQISDGQIAWVWQVMAETCPHQYLILTKRPQRMLDFIQRWADLTGERAGYKGVRGPQATREAHPSGRGQLFAAYLEELGKSYGGKPPLGAIWPTFDWAGGPRWWPTYPLSNVWRGVTVENQARAEERIPLLLQVPAAKHWLSYEPALGPLDLNPWLWQETTVSWGPGGENDWDYDVKPRENGLSWVVAGCESGPDARPMDEEWVRQIKNQCQAAYVPFYYKQKMQDNKLVHLPELDGKQWTEMPR